MSIPRLINFTPRHIRQLVSLTIILFLAGFAIHYVFNGTRPEKIVELADSAKADHTKSNTLQSWMKTIEDMQSNRPQVGRADGYRRMNLQTSVIQVEPGNTYADIQTDRGTIKMCVYPQEEDTQSRVLLSNSRTWQSTIVQTIESIFACDLEINLIDVGAELGLLSVVAAKWRRRAIAIEASWDNVGKIRQTLAKEDIQHAVAVLHNTVFDQEGRLEVIQSKQNRSDTILVQDLEDDAMHPTGYYTSKVNVIYLDDLRPIAEAVVVPKVILRINLADSKYNAFVESRAFFHEKWVEVPYILMKWTWKRGSHKAEAVSLITYLTSFEYRPYDNLFTMTRLDVMEWNDWPHEIIWLRDGEECSGRTDLQEIRNTFHAQQASAVKTTVDIAKQAMSRMRGIETTEGDYKEEKGVIEAPEVHEPAKPAPVTNEPEKPAPLAQEPEKPAPVDEEPAKPAPVAEEPAKPAPVAEEPANTAPVAQEPQKPAPVAEEPANPAPVAQEPAKPAAVAQEPAKPAPVAEEPAKPAPVA